MPPRTQTSAGMETVDETVKRAQKLIGKQPAAAPTPSTGRPQVAEPTTPVVTPETLTPTAVIDVPPAPEPVVGPAIASELEIAADDFTKQMESDRASAEQSKQTALEAYLENLTNFQGLATLTADEYAKAGGVDSIAPELNDINDKIRREQLALRRSIERIEAKGGGLEMGATAEIGNLERESFAKQADLSVIQMAAQGRYDSAKEAADRAVLAKLEQQMQYTAALKTMYEDAKDLFDTAEKREFETLLADRERKLTEQKEQLDAIYDLGLQAQTDGAPTDVVERMLKAKTREEALAAGGQYIGLLDRQVKEANIEQSRASAASSRASAYNSYTNAALNELQMDQAVKKQQQMEEAIASGAVILDEDQQDIAYKLGKDFESEAAEFKKQVGAYNRIVASAEDPSAAGDLALIFNYMKMLDPGSVVREGEFATAQNTAGVPAIIRSKYNQAISGERLSPDTRNDFVDRSTRIYNAALEQQMDLEDRYQQKATQVFGLPENAAELVVQDIRATGAVSDVVFGLQLNQASDAQLQDLKAQGLIP